MFNWLQKLFRTKNKIVFKDTKTSGEKTGSFEKLVVGKVMALKKHPNADKLQITVVDVGQDQPLEIVCGGTNLRENMWVAVALPGAKVRWHGEGEPVMLQKAKIREVESYGMICSANEIGLEKEFPCLPSEVINLNGLENLTVGQPLQEIISVGSIL